MPPRAVVEVALGERSYPVHIGRGTFDELGAILAPLRPTAVACGLAEGVARLYPKVKGALGTGLAARFEFPSGEKAKSWDSLLAAWTAFAGAGLDRGSVVIAVGGGSLTDLVGFAAATWHRGIPWIAVPTTFLGMVDAAIGGKTAINLPGGKNLVGAFHHPRAVVCDLAFLDTLPPEEFATGLAEVVKAGIVGDPGLFTLLEGRGNDLRRDGDLRFEVVRRAVAVKAAIVGRDERESGERRVLNFGHTVGHALEKASGFGLPHGRAVAAGMVAECRIACARKLLGPEVLGRVERTIEALGLPTSSPALDRRAILDALSADKKARGGRLVFALPRDLGRVEIVEGIGPAEVAAALEAAAP